MEYFIKTPQPSSNGNHVLCEGHCDPTAQTQSECLQKYFAKTLKLRNALKKEFWNRKVSHSNVSEHLNYPTAHIDIHHHNHRTTSLNNVQVVHTQPHTQLRLRHQHQAKHLHHTFAY